MLNNAVLQSQIVNLTWRIGLLENRLATVSRALIEQVDKQERMKSRDVDRGEIPFINSAWSRINGSTWNRINVS